MFEYVSGSENGFDFTAATYCTAIGNGMSHAMAAAGLSGDSKANLNTGMRESRIRNCTAARIHAIFSLEEENAIVNTNCRMRFGLAMQKFDLDALRRAAATCRDCPLGALATQTVWGEGSPSAVCMLVGEQPGDREDREGRPFVGPAGQLLERAMAHLGWQRSAFYITNAVKHFKYEWRDKVRKHKTPAQLEILACHHWLEAEIAAVRPLRIVALGATAARALLGRPIKVSVDRGRWLQRDDGLRVLITVHPSSLLRGDPAQRTVAFDAWLTDLRKAGEAEADDNQ